MKKKLFKRHYKKILIILATLTLIEFIYVVTLGDATNDFKDRLPFIVAATIASETLFLAGIAIMAYTIEHEIGWNPFSWRGHLKDVLKKVPNNPIFWVGFWINASGAFLTGLVWALAVLFGLPFEAWGLLWLPVTDIALTVALRLSIVELKRENIIG